MDGKIWIGPDQFAESLHEKKKRTREPLGSQNINCLAKKLEYLKVVYHNIYVFKNMLLLSLGLFITLGILLGLDFFFKVSFLH